MNLHKSPTDRKLFNPVHEVDIILRGKSMSEELIIRRATSKDLPYVIATERMPGYDVLVGRWDETRHLQALHDAHYAYFIAETNDDLVGFLIIRDWKTLERVTCIKRIAVSIPGKQIGRRFLAAVVETIFTQTDAFRIWLGVFLENERAKRAYSAVGFVAEGVARGNAYFNDKYHDELIMALLRTEWSGWPTT